MYTRIATDALRDQLRARFEDGDNAIVVEFEVWSSLGAAVDARWLLARGH
jgi:hypothetical protein